MERGFERNDSGHGHAAGSSHSASGDDADRDPKAKGLSPLSLVHGMNESRTLLIDGGDDLDDLKPLDAEWAATHILLSLRYALCRCALNQYTQFVDSDGDYVWRSTSDFVPVQSRCFGNMTIGERMSMTFDFVWNGRTSSSETVSEWFFRIGADADRGGNGCYGNLNRYPALSITADSPPFLRLYLSENGACSSHYDLDGFGPIDRGRCYHFAADWNSTSLTVAMESADDRMWRQHWRRNRTSPHFVGETVPVWWSSNKFGSTDYVTANGTFSDVVIRSTVPSVLATSSPSPSAVIDGIVQIETPSPSAGADGEGLDEADESSPSTAVLIVLAAAATVLILGVAIPGLLWQRRRRRDLSASTESMEIKHLSMLYLGTGRHGEVSPPSNSGAPGRPRNMQNLPDRPMSPPQHRSPGHSDDDDMRSPLVMADEKEDDEIEDMYPQIARRLSGRHQSARKEEGRRASALRQFQPPTRGRPPSGSMAATPTAHGHDGDDGDGGDQQREHPFMITVDGADPVLASDEELVDDIDAEAVGAGHRETFDELMGSDWTDGAESVIVDGRHSRNGTKGGLGLNGRHRLEQSVDSLQIQQSVDTIASDLDVVDGDLWTADGDDAGNGDGDGGGDGNGDEDGM